MAAYRSAILKAGLLKIDLTEFIQEVTPKMPNNVSQVAEKGKKSAQEMLDKRQHNQNRGTTMRNSSCYRFWRTCIVITILLSSPVICSPKGNEGVDSAAIEMQR